MFQPPTYQSTSARQAIVLFTLVISLLVILGYVLLFFQLRQLQMNEAQRLLNNIVEEINHKIDHQEYDFDNIIKFQSSTLTSYELIIFTPTGRSIILTNLGYQNGFTLPSWQMTAENKNTLYFKNSGIEAWYELHNQYQLYADIRANSWLSWLNNFAHPLYFLPIIISLIALLVFLFLLKRKARMWQQIINYSQNMHNLVTHEFKPLPISPLVFDSYAAQIGQALNRFGYQLTEYFHTIHELNHRQQMLVENAPIPLFLLNRKGEILYFNQRFASVFMTAFRSDATYLLTDFVTGADKLTQQKLVKLSENQTALTLSVTDIQLSQYFDLRLNPLHNRFGKLQGFSGVLEIVGYYHTQLQQAWLTDKQQQDKLASFDKLWAVLGHELRTPLTGIIGMLALFNEENDNLTPEQLDILTTLQYSGNTMLQLLNDMLDMAKLDAGKLQLNLEKVDILKLCRQVCALMAANARRQHIDLLYHADPTIPRNIMTDDGRLRQIILNLLSNAIKFTQQGYVALLLDMVNSSDKIIEQKLTHPPTAKQWLKITVKDTGIGISQKEQQKLFSFFNQANDSISRQFGGTGLGLAISNSFAQMMGGFIHLHSEVGKGSEFQVYLPLETTSISNITFQYNTASYHIQLIIFVKYSISVSYIKAIFASLNIPTIINLTINDTIIEQLNEQLDPKRMPIFLVDELCYIGYETLFKQIPNFHIAKKILTSMDTERSVNPELLAQFDSFLQKPINMSSFMAEMARLYDSDNADLSQPIKAQATATLTVQQQYEQFLLKLTKKPLSTDNSLLPAPVVESEATNAAVMIPTALSQKTILIAEDNLVNQKIAKKLLEKMGYVVIVAENGQEAINLLQQNRSKIVLILMDCHMPLLDGLEATRLIRTNQDSIPIIALTADDSEEDKLLCLNAGMDGFLTKPLTKEKLSEIFNRFMI